MLLSSPRTDHHKKVVPAFVFVGVTAVLLFTRRHELLSEPAANVLLLLAMYGCAAWVVWRPWRLKVADRVEDQSGVLHIRRGAREVRLPYSDIVAHEYLRIGAGFGVKLTFKQPNEFGLAIGFYLNEESDASGAFDPGEETAWSECRLTSSCSGR